MERPRRSKKVAADWTKLPSDLLILSAKNLNNISDYIRFCNVHPWWRLATSPVVDGYHRLRPSVILPYRGTGPTLSLFSPFHHRHYDLRLPEIQGKWVYASSHGWLVVLNPDYNPRILGPAISLLDPFSGVHKSLPRLPKQFRYSTLCKVLLCFDPAATHQPLQQLMVAIWLFDWLILLMQGADYWIRIRMPCNSVFGDMVIFENSLYVVDHIGTSKADQIWHGTLYLSSRQSVWIDIQDDSDDGKGQKVYIFNSADEVKPKKLASRMEELSIRNGFCSLPSRNAEQRQSSMIGLTWIVPRLN